MTIIKLSSNEIIAYSLGNNNRAAQKTTALRHQAYHRFLRKAAFRILTHTGTIPLVI